MIFTNNTNATEVIGTLRLQPGESGIVPKEWEARMRDLRDKGAYKPGLDAFRVGRGIVTETSHAPIVQAAEPIPSKWLEWSDKDALAWIKRAENRATLAAMLDDLRQRETIEPGFNPRPRLQVAIGERIADLIAAEPSGKPITEAPSGWSYGPSLGSPEQDIAQLRRLIATEPRENVRREMTAMLTLLGGSMVTSGAAKLYGAAMQAEDL